MRRDAAERDNHRVHWVTLAAPSDIERCDLAAVVQTERFA
jgi:hypothetical protein